MAIIEKKSKIKIGTVSADSIGELKFTWKVAINFFQGFAIAILFLLTSWGWKYLVNKFNLGSDWFCSATGYLLSGLGLVVFLIYSITGIVLLLKSAWRILK